MGCIEIREHLHEHRSGNSSASMPPIMLRFLLLFAISATVSCANLPESELTALYDLYNATNGNNWSWLQATQQPGVPWMFAGSPNPCTDNWQGVNCTLNNQTDVYNVKHLELGAHNLVGPLPDSIQLLANLTILGLRFNKLSGTIPAAIGKMGKLQSLEIDGNQFTGTIPRTLGNLTELLHLDLFTNHLNATIPPELCKLQNLVYLNMKVNRLTGTLPDCIGDMLQLTYLNVHTNRLDGALPAALGQLTQLKVLDIGANLFSGYLPVSMQYMSSLTQLYIDVNKFSGPIPKEWGNLPAIEAFYLDINALTGTIPVELAQMSTLLDLYIDYNQLTGTVPGILSTLSLLQYLFVNNNYLTGTLPISLGNLTQLQYLEVHNNYLHGTVPTEYRQLSSLMVLLIQDNFFSGPIMGIFDPSAQQALSTIQINNNQITGSIPAAVFELPRLNTFVAVSNCFHGALPTTVCDSISMTSLVLDGLSSAPACRDRLLPGLSASYIVADVVDGTIPACLLQLANLSTLHLSGNGFTGTLPGISTAQLGAALSDLSLSHNLLSGSIPTSIQTREWLNLDLSYNRFSGTLKSSFGSLPHNATRVSKPTTKLTVQQIERIIGFEIAGLVSNYYFNVMDELNALNSTRIPAVSLENNRLSGKIPSYMQAVTDISILGSNVFYCGVKREELPVHDSNSKNYECASIAFDIPYYVWLSLSLMVVVAAVLIYNHRYGTVLIAALQQWWRVFDTAEVKNQRYIARVNKYVDLLCNTAGWSTVYIIVLLLPFYCISGYFYSTLTHQYAWVASAAFSTGTVTFALEFPLLVCFLVIVGVLFTLRLASAKGGASDRATIADAVSAHSLRSMLEWRVLAITLLYITINIVIVVGVNAAFVYVAIYENSALLLLAQILLTMFKLFWNSVCSVVILESIVRTFNRHAPVQDSDRAHTANQYATLRIFVALLNNILIPCLVVAVVSPNCFYNVFDAAPAVTSSYTYDLCLINNNDHCVVYLPVVSATEYNPPFRYSYQCSSSMITYYSPAFVILSVVITFVIPAAKMIGVMLHQYVGRDTTVFYLLELSLPAILLPVRDPSSTIILPAYFDPNRELVRLITYLGLLMTFGAVFPPLAVALAVTVLASAYFSRASVAHFLYSALEHGWPQYVEVIERECAQVGSSAVLHNSMWMLITISCWFYTLFLFDTLGDALGFDDALWVLIVVPLIPACFYIIVVLYARFWSKGVVDDAPDGAGYHVEMSVSVDYRNSSIANNPIVNALWRKDA